MKNLMFAALLTTLSVGSLDPVLAAPAEEARPRTTRLVPTFRNGQPRGFKVFAIQPGSIYERARFEPGDTLLEIDGAVVTTASPDPLEAAARGGAPGTVIRISVERRTKPHRLELTR